MIKPKIENMSKREIYVPALKRIVSSDEALEAFLVYSSHVEIAVISKLNRVADGGRDSVELEAANVISELMVDYIMDIGISYLMKYQYTKIKDNDSNVSVIENYGNVTDLAYGISETDIRGLDKKIFDVINSLDESKGSDDRE